MSRSLLALRSMICRPMAVPLPRTSLRRGLGIGSWIDEHGNAVALGHELAQQLQVASPPAPRKKAHARDVAARPVEAGDETDLDRVVARSRRRSESVVVAALAASAAGVLPRDNHGHLRRTRSAARAGSRSVWSFRPAVFDRHVLALDKACFLQALAEAAHEVRARPRATCWRNPITGIAGCCARAASGHAAAAPPRSVMNSRRFMGDASTAKMV